MQTTAKLRAKPGKYLTFALGVEEFGLDVPQVREIIGPTEIASVSQAPSYIRGVIDLRGQVIPVVDLHTRLNMTTVRTSSETCIIIVETEYNQEKFSTGVAVDRVRGVLDIASEQIEPASTCPTRIERDFILGMAKMTDSVKILLDIDRILGSSQLAELFEVRA